MPNPPPRYLPFLAKDSSWSNSVLYLTEPSAYIPGHPWLIPTDRLNSNFNFVKAFRSLPSLLAEFPVRNESMFLVHPRSLRQLLVSYKNFRLQDMVSILRCLHVHVGSDSLKDQVSSRLFDLQDSKANLLYLFEFRSRRPNKPRAPGKGKTLGKRRLPDSSLSVSPAPRRKKTDIPLRCQSSQSCPPAPPDPGCFPYLCPKTRKRQLLENFQSRIHPSAWNVKPCASCAVAYAPGQISVVQPDAVDFALLRNPAIPDQLLPTEYNLEAYDHAILYPPGMLDLEHRGAINLCRHCESYLTGERPRVPEFALANFYYFARERLPEDVKDAFTRASPCDLQLVSRCRASNITFRFTESIGSSQFGLPSETSQFFCKGNTIVLPQDPDGVRKLLPPSPEDINKAVCALFVSREKPSLQNIARLGPVLVSKPTVKTLLDFLLTKNPYYRDGGTEFSQENFDALFAPEDARRQKAIPQSVELGFLQLDEAVRSSTSDYTDRYAFLGNTEGSDEILMEPVGYTDGDHTPQNYTDMKVKALSWCRRGHAFIKSQAGSAPFSDRDEAFLSSVFPHLDPWGLVALNHPHRKYKSSLLRQVQHLLKLHDSPFQRDPAFAFILWNIVQRSEVNKCMSFRVKERQRDSIIKDILSFPPDTLDQLSEKWRLNPSARPTTADEKKIFRVLRKLRHVGSSLKGSAAQKICLRNEIRALINTLGTPALFVTLNPADVHHPLVRILAGADSSTMSHLEKGVLLEQFDKQQRALLVAQNPAAAARFFDVMISAFLNSILCPADGPGLFGRCQGYYGTVEAQGKGTLHLHMLIWLEGHPNPQDMRDKFESHPGFKDAVFEWLDDIIATSIPGTADVVVPETDARPALPKDEPDPRSFLAPQAADFDDIDEFYAASDEYLSKLVIRTNWHVHSDTCWKKLKKGEARDDAHCRLGMDGSTRATAELDSDSGSILYRRLHPRINNYNPTTIHALQCNMDIKHIGSGEGAKACLYYVTDYITKFSLPVHSGLAALSYAIKRNNEKFDGATWATAETKEKSLLTKSVNAMMARMEISHQQVMSYLVGGGDHYSSHTFRNLYWGEVDRYIRKLDQQRDGSEAQPSEERDDEDDSPTGGSVPYEPEVVLTLKDKSVTATNQILDYTLRPSSSDFSNLSIWDYVSRTERISLTEDSQNALPAAKTSGPKRTVRNTFHSDHPQHDTHLVRLRSPLIPVLLGPTISRDRTPEERESWCRAMLILFKPWRSLDDLRGIGQSWKDAFEHFEFSEDSARVMQNINVLHECKDARSSYDELRRAGKVPVDLIVGEYVANEVTEGDLEDALLQDDSLDADSDVDEDEVAERSKAVRSKTSTSCDPEVQRAIALMKRRSKETLASQHQPPEGCFPFSMATADDYANVASYTEFMKSLKRDGKPQLSHCARPPQRSSADTTPSTAKVVVENLTNFHTVDERMNVVHPIPTVTSPIGEIDAVESEFGLKNNVEQSRAFRIVAEHMLSDKNTSEQLLMYLGGVGGTGKSHVINATVELFRRCGVAESLRLSAPTGIAAVLIRGHTIHSLTLLPKGVHRNDPSKLEDLWRDVQWLFIDEISMISAKLLSEISHQICIAKGSCPTASGKPFGGINVLFAGDFGQLRPVKAKSLFSHELVDKIRINTAQSPAGQSNLHGAFLWRSVNRHVELRKNWRHMLDPMYANLVGRVRVGKAWQGRRKHLDDQKGNGANYKKPDWDVLLSRTLEHLSHEDGSLESFADAPFIVARKIVRDRLNAMRITEFAESTGQAIEYMVAKDKIGKRLVTETERERLVRLSSSTTKDSLGILPLVPGMKVMITENVALAQSVVNGAEGTLVSVKYRKDSSGNKFAICAFVKIPGSGVKIDGLPVDVVPIIPTSTQFTYISPQGAKFHISRSQLPLLPAYAYTDYKAQGRTLKIAIVDLADCTSLQSVYVMLSRVKSLGGLAILRWFKSTKLYQNLQEEFRNEFNRLRRLHEETEEWFGNRAELTVDGVDRGILIRWQNIQQEQSISNNLASKLD